MPTPENDKIEKNKPKEYKTIKWQNYSFVKAYGIYYVSTSNYLIYLPQTNTKFFLSPKQIALWRKNAPNITLDNKSISYEDLIEHLRKFWLPDETILYIGKAEKQLLSDRLSQYFWHKVGKRSPHKGGYWLKLLENQNSMYVHLIVVKGSKPSKIEESMLQYFINNVSPTTKELLLDK